MKDNFLVFAVIATIALIAYVVYTDFLPVWMDKATSQIGGS